MADVTRFKVGYHDSPRAGRLALVTMDNGRDHTRPNTFGAESLASLDAALDELAAQPDVKGLLLTGKPFVFAVGADLGSFTGATAAFAREAAAWRSPCTATPGPCRRPPRASPSRRSSCRSSRLGAARSSPPGSSGPRTRSRRSSPTPWTTTG
jgi:hypothetical protein